jgi:hypothetical protein
MVTEVLVGLANFLFIFLKAFQQRNVAFMHYPWVLPTSAFMATVEVGVVGAVAVEATRAHTFFDMVPLVVAIALGGGLGCMASMWVHNRYIGVKHG